MFTKNHFKKLKNENTKILSLYFYQNSKNCMNKKKWTKKIINWRQKRQGRKKFETHSMTVVTVRQYSSWGLYSLDFFIAFSKVWNSIMASLLFLVGGESLPTWYYPCDDRRDQWSLSSWVDWGETLKQESITCHRI